MTINSLLKTIKGNYYTTVTIDDQLSLSADTNYLRALSKARDERTRAEIRSVSMDVFHHHSGNEYVKMCIDLKS